MNLAKEGEIQRLAFQFKTSKHNSFNEKMNAIQFSPAWIKLNSDVVALQNNMNFDEYFDLTELVGSNYTDNKPLIDITAIMNEAFAQKFKNLFYNNYPLDQIQLERQDDENDRAGIPPTRALPIFSSYLQYLDKEKGNAFLKQTFPYQYNLFYYFKNDWYEMVSKAASKYVTTASQNRPNNINTLIQSSFGAIPKGIYKVEARYILPGNKPVSNKIFNYEFR